MGNIIKIDCPMSYQNYFPFKYLSKQEERRALGALLSTFLSILTMYMYI